MAHRVRSRNLENEEAKARYRAVKIQPQWVVMPRKIIHVHYIKFLSVVNLGKTSLIRLSQTEHQFCVQRNLLLIHKVPLRLIKVSG